MRIVLKPGRLVLLPQNEGEELEVEVWKEGQVGNVLHLRSLKNELLLVDLGPKADACNEPVQISSMVKDPILQLISNFAHTPFILDGREYASIEGFWQGLKFESETERRRIASLPGKEAKQAGDEQGYGEMIDYEGEMIPVGTWAHWQLMKRACEAKFTQNDEAREALLSTNNRPLTHRMRRDSKTIPGVIMADIWMRIRARLRNEEEKEEE